VTAEEIKEITETQEDIPDAIEEENLEEENFEG
jgi:hypothetical protein